MALVFHDEFAPTVAEALATLPEDRRPRLLLQVAHAGGREPIDGAVDYSRAVADAPRGAPTDREPSGDDLVFVYTGGTTGSPKAVMWRSDDLYLSLWQMARPGTQPPDVEAAMRADKRAATCLARLPADARHRPVHRAVDARRAAARSCCSTRRDSTPTRCGTRSSASTCRCAPSWATRSLARCSPRSTPRPTDGISPGSRAITSSGVTWSPETKRGLLAHLPHVLLIDSLGASEGIMTRTETREGDDIAPARFKASDRVVVVTDEGALAEPGDGVIGMLGVGGAIPLGYYKDPEKTAATFRSVGGRRYSIPGDYATVEADGTIRLLGRGSACINTGGEKVYPEEVELALRSHPDVFDCVVVGIPDDRWGEMVVALVHTYDGKTIDADRLGAHCRASLAAYKVPKRVLVVDSLERSPAGKADYKHLREIAASRLRSEVHP